MPFSDLSAVPHRSPKLKGHVFSISDHSPAIEMRDLYLECASHLVRDEAFRIHVLMMPDMHSDHFVVSAGDDPDLDRAVERMTGNTVGPMDCIAVLGSDVLGMHRNEDEMTEIVLADIAQHINRLWPVADRSSGWVGPHLSLAAIRGMLTMAHPILRSTAGQTEAAHGIMADALKGMASHMYRYASVDGLRRENAPAVAAVDRICKRVAETNGEYLSLPVRITDIVDAGRALLSSVLDEMDVRPVGVI